MPRSLGYKNKTLHGDASDLRFTLEVKNGLDSPNCKRSVNTLIHSEIINIFTYKFISNIRKLPFLVLFSHRVFR